MQACMQACMQAGSTSQTVVVALWIGQVGEPVAKFLSITNFCCAWMDLFSQCCISVLFFLGYSAVRLSEWLEATGASRGRSWWVAVNPRPSFLCHV